jgi:lipid II:glycine glycyltransferase (peptidoglycan interpeptide bridge formation enzyme)
MAQLLLRRLPLGLTIGYIPKGPVLDWHDVAARQAIFTLIHLKAKKHRAIFLKIEPDLWESTESETATEFLTKIGFRSGDTVQPRATAIIDIRGSEDDILATMKQKARYNIRLARKKGVSVRQGNINDIADFHRLSQVTSGRDGFGIHNLDYYQTAHRLFSPDQCALLIAEFEGEPLAGLMVFRQGDTAYYFYGASSNEKRNLMPTYLIQWEAIRWAKVHGCTSYDLWGIPDATPDVLEAEFEHRHDGLWGVYRFKRGFGGEIKRTVGAYDYIYQPKLYRLYQLSRLDRFQKLFRSIRSYA